MKRNQRWTTKLHINAFYVIVALSVLAVYAMYIGLEYVAGGAVTGIVAALANFTENVGGNGDHE